MRAVRCCAGQCTQKLRPLFKPVPDDPETWLYRECDGCFRPTCERHSSEVGGKILCDACREALAARQSVCDLVRLLERPAIGFELN